MKKILIFGGTTEGRNLAEFLCQFDVLIVVSVATDYGKTLLPKGEHIVTVAKRMTREEMIDYFKKQGFDSVVDATHPFAQEVSRNISFACCNTNTPYMRLLREEQQLGDSGIVMVENIKEAADYLNNTKGNVLLTTGSKELDAFTDIENFAERLFPRVLPTPAVVQKCYDLGFTAKQLICMQGPFTKECNIAMLKQVKADYLVTKESGDIGGFYEKIEAAQAVGALVIAIGRPKEEGYSYEEMKSTLTSGIARRAERQVQVPEKKYFPMFFDLNKKRVLVVGGGTIGKRRMETLQKFGCEITVIAPFICEELNNETIRWKERPYENGDCNGYDMVLATTDNRTVNHEIYKACTKLGICVNVGDCKEECSFYFPAVVDKGSVVIGITTSGVSHSLNKEIAQNIRENLNRLVPNVGEKKCQE